MFTVGWESTNVRFIVGSRIVAVFSEAVAVAVEDPAIVADGRESEFNKKGISPGQ